MTLETNGLEVAITFYCITYPVLGVAQRSHISVKVTNLHADGTPVKVSFVVTANGNVAERRPAAKLVNRDDSTWLTKETVEGMAFSIFVYKGDTLIASSRLLQKGKEPCQQGDQQ